MPKCTHSPPLSQSSSFSFYTFTSFSFASSSIVPSLLLHRSAACLPAETVWPLTLLVSCLHLTYSRSPGAPKPRFATSGPLCSSSPSLPPALSASPPPEPPDPASTPRSLHSDSEPGGFPPEPGPGQEPASASRGAAAALARPPGPGAAGAAAAETDAGADQTEILP